MVVPGLAHGDEAEAAEAVDMIVIEVSNLQDDTGQVGCALFSKEDGFPIKIKKADKRLTVQSKSKKATCAFEGVKPGTYAISVMHDTDMSGDLNTNMVGRPKEWWGVTNNAPAHRFSAPTFDECKFQYSGGKKTMKIKMQK